LVEFFYFGISYDNPCSLLSFSLLPAPGSRTSFVHIHGKNFIDNLFFTQEALSWVEEAC
jgi:hypothetical protein